MRPHLCAAGSLSRLCVDVDSSCREESPSGTLHSLDLLHETAGTLHTCYCLHTHTQWISIGKHSMLSDAQCHQAESELSHLAKLHQNLVMWCLEVYRLIQLYTACLCTVFTSLAGFMKRRGEVCVWRVCVCSILQQQFHTADTARGTTVVQRSDTIDGGSIHLDTHTHVGEGWAIHFIFNYNVSIRRFWEWSIP